MNVSSKLAEIDVFDTRTEQKYHHYRSLEMANPECWEPRGSLGMTYEIRWH